MNLFLAAWSIPCLVAATVAAQQDLAVVRGRAIDRDGKPVAGCAASVFELGERFTTKDLMGKPLATTDAAGRYELRAKKDRYQVVVVTGKGHQVCVQRLQAEASAERVVPDALMLPGATLRGRVRDPDGKPIAGALVRVEDPLAKDAFVTTWFESQAVTDERGIFEVPGVPRTGLHVTAGARGFPAVSRLAAHDSPLDLTLAPTGVVRGRVTDADGKPAAGVKVGAVTVERRDEVEQIVTDTEGRFELTAPNAFRFRVGAYESVAPHRQFSSGLLSGPADDVAVTAAATAPRGARRVRLRAVDAATKADVAEFTASWSSFDTRTAAMLLLYRSPAPARYRGEAVLHVVRDAHNQTNGSILVEAPGHGFAIVAVPDEPDAPLIAELPAECTLTGQVVDEVTGKPAVGAAVRALPQLGIGGGGPDPWQTGAISDANGNYRIGGLAPGKYAVQAYGAGRQAPRSRSVTLAADAPASLDLTIPKPLYLEFELVGDVPAGCLAGIAFGGVTWHGVGESMLEAPLPQLPPFMAIGEKRAFTVGPVGAGAHEVQLRVPARDRLGSVLSIPIGPVERAKPARLQLPDLRQVLHTGRVRLPPDVPTERVAVIAHPKQRDAFSLQPPFAVCVASDGSFVIDLPPGSYTLQLADLATKIVFHTEENERTFGAEPEAIDVTPSIRWLQVDLLPAASGKPVVIHCIQVDAPRAARSLPAAMGMMTGATNDRQTFVVPWRGAGTELRWLVPPAAMKLQPMQTFEILSPASRGWQAKPIDAAVVEPGSENASVTFRIPPPPDDAALGAPPPK